jgi:hypothetical protein
MNYCRKSRLTNLDPVNVQQLLQWESHGAAASLQAWFDTLHRDGFLRKALLVAAFAQHQFLSSPSYPILDLHQIVHRLNT